MGRLACKGVILKGRMEPLKPRTKVILFAAPIFAAVIAWTLSFMLMPLDQDAFQNMLRVAGLPIFGVPGTDDYGLFSMMIHDALILMFSGAGFFCGVRLKKSTAFFAWLQLFAGANRSANLVV